MPKAYWISVYQEIIDPAKLAEYVRLGIAALQAAGGRFLARGKASVAYEAVEQAVAAYESPAYQRALAALKGGAKREIRIIPGVDP